MTDLSESLYEKIGTLLEGQRAAVARYAGLLDAQRAALKSDDIELLADVSGNAAHLLAGLESASRHLTAARGPVAETAGPRNETVRTLLAALSIELERTLVEVRQFAEALQGRRGQLVRTIQLADGGQPGGPGNSFRSGHPDSAFLDRSG